MNIPDEIIEQIRQQTDIVDIVGEVVDLKKRGSNFMGKCPFHNEKTPSFAVSQDKGIYKCFGCGKSGNVFSFMIDYHGMSFLDAAKELAKRSGIRLPDENAGPKAKAQFTRNELALKALEAAAAYYVKLLGTPAGKTAESYFRKRAFSAELIKSFSLGYSDESWDSLIRELHRQGFSDASLEDAGLVVKNENGGIYDRFRGRVMFPVQNFMGKVIGFGARTLSDDPSQPKYINSPQTLVYDKSRTLYGLHQAKNEIRNKRFAILTEGYADVLTLHQAGYRNAVASSGTSLTKEQLEILGKYCKKLYFVYDADSAGVKAAERGLDLALEQGFDINIVRLPAGEDPDSLVREHGSNIFRMYLDDAVSFLDFKVELLKKEGGLDTPAGKADAVRSLLKLISKIPDRLQHNDHISHLAALLKISEFELHKIYEEKESSEKSSAKPRNIGVKPTHQTGNRRQPGNDPVLPKKSAGEPKKTILAEEEFLIKLAVTNPEAMGLMTASLGLVPESFYTQEGKRIFSILYELARQNTDLLSVIFSPETLEESDRNYLTTLAMSDAKPSDNWDRFSRGIPTVDMSRMIKDAMYKLELIYINSSLPVYQAMLKTVSFEEQKTVLEKIKLLNDRRQTLHNLIVI